MRCFIHTTAIALTACAVLWPVASARAQMVVIKDAFQERPGELVGVKPDPVDAPGATWQLNSGDGSYETSLNTIPPSIEDNPDVKIPAAAFHHTASVGISLATTGSYVKPSILTVRADMCFTGDSPTGYCYLGFYSKLPGGGPRGDIAANFTGFEFQKTGYLQLIENGAPVAATGVGYTGAYDPARPVTLTYTVDLTKGAVYNVTLGGSSSVYTFDTRAFTNSATAFFGIGAETDGGSAGFIRNLQIYGSGVPAR